MTATEMKLTIQYSFRGNTYIVEIFYDAEAKIWCAFSANFTGLVLEDESREKLLSRLELAIPEMVELNYG